MSETPTLTPQPGSPEWLSANGYLQDGKCYGCGCYYWDPDHRGQDPDCPKILHDDIAQFRAQLARADEQLAAADRLAEGAQACVDSERVLPRLVAALADWAALREVQA